MAFADNTFPFEICDIDPETNASMKDQFEDFEEHDGFIRVGPKGYFFPKLYLNDASALFNMQTRHDQVFVAGYPRSGTTWLQQLVWLIIHDLDYAENEKTNMIDKWIYFDLQAKCLTTAHVTLNESVIEYDKLIYPGVELVLKRGCPNTPLAQTHPDPIKLLYSLNLRLIPSNQYMALRLVDKISKVKANAIFRENAIKNHIHMNKNNKVSEENIAFLMANIPSMEVIQNHSFLKTHLPLSLLPSKILETSKVVYVARDPRDVIVSFYHLCKGGFWLFKKDFKTMWKSFLKGTLVFCPYFEHVKEFWEQRHNPNLLFLFYEDIQNDRLNTLRRVADFFNKTYTDEQLLVASRYLDFNNLKDNKSFNFSSFKEHGVTKPNAEPFVRKGIVGGWRKYFDEEMNREAEQWIKDQLRETDLCFPTLNFN